MIMHHKLTDVPLVYIHFLEPFSLRNMSRDYCRVNAATVNLIKQIIIVLSMSILNSYDCDKVIGSETCDLRYIDAFH